MTPTDAKKLSRAEIETLCLLHAVGRDGARPATVTEALGLSPSLTGAVTSALVQLANLDLVRFDDDKVLLTPVGAAML